MKRSDMRTAGSHFHPVTEPVRSNGVLVTGWIVKSFEWDPSTKAQRPVFGVLLPGLAVQADGAWWTPSWYVAARRLAGYVRSGVCKRGPRFAAYFG
jgi:hypothetical protein